MIDYMFYQNSYPFRFVEKISIAREHFNGVMLANETRVGKNRAEFVLACMYWYNNHQKPCRLVKIIQDKGKWNTQPLTKMIELEEAPNDRIRDCFLIDSDQVLLVF